MTASRSYDRFLLELLVRPTGSSSYQAFLVQQGLRQVFVTHQTHVAVGTYWAVKVEREDRPVSVHLTQLEAIDAMGDLLRAIPGGGSLMIHRRNGRFREERTINHPDPFPPFG